jgi:hypothetical protein
MSMNLKKATLLATLSISYTFLLRNLGTFLPGVFKSLPVAQAVTLLSLLAGLAVVLFFFFFSKEYARKGELRLQKASILAIIGSCAMLYLNVKSLVLIFKMNLSPYLVMHFMRAHFIDPLIPWVSSIFILIFFIVLHQETRRGEETRLRKATLFAVIGSSIGSLERTFVLANYLLYSRPMGWFTHLPTKTAIIFTPIYLFSFFAILYFFVSFYRHQT